MMRFLPGDLFFSPVAGGIPYLNFFNNTNFFGGIAVFVSMVFQGWIDHD